MLTTRQQIERRGARLGERLGLRKGRQEGIQKGRQEGILEMAKVMLAAGESLEKVIKFTNLTRAVASNLVKQLGR